MIITTTLIYLLRKRIKKFYLRIEDWLEPRMEKVICVICIAGGTAYIISMVLVLGGYR